MAKEDYLNRLLHLAAEDSAIKDRLLATRQAKDPALALCEASTELGIPLSVGELFAGGEEFCSNLRKSVNGGATDPIESWGDSYEQLMASLEALKG